MASASNQTSLPVPSAILKIGNVLCANFVACHLNLNFSFAIMSPFKNGSFSPTFKKSTSLGHDS